MTLLRLQRELSLNPYSLLARNILYSFINRISQDNKILHKAVAKRKQNYQHLMSY
jgi:hypothetical protein